MSELNADIGFIRGFIFTESGISLHKNLLPDEVDENENSIDLGKNVPKHCVKVHFFNVLKN